MNPDDDVGAGPMESRVESGSDPPTAIADGWSNQADTTEMKTLPSGLSVNREVHEHFEGNGAGETPEPTTLTLVEQV